MFTLQYRILNSYVTLEYFITPAFSDLLPKVIATNYGSELETSLSNKIYCLHRGGINRPFSLLWDTDCRDMFIFPLCKVLKELSPVQDIANQSKDNVRQLWWGC